ncbi:protein-glutamate methylesterase/protein-glutamine glutaminase [Thermosulfuriphilus sp.]
MPKIKVLVCDDSALMRRVLRKIIEADPRLEVVGTARDGKDVIEKARSLRPDVITLDINMPKMDGLTALKILIEEGIAPVIMVSSLTQKGAPITLQALEMGAFDYVAKPGGTVSINMEEVARELIGKIKAAARSGTVRKLKRQEIVKLSPPSPRALIRPRISVPKGELPPFAAVAIGISTGGPKTIFEVLPYLPADLPAVVFLVQHMPPSFTESYAQRLDKRCTLKVFHAETGLKVEPGSCFVGKGGYHLTVFKKIRGDLIVRNTKTPRHLFMPSVDVMMESVLSVFGPQTVGVLMTGMGDDGAEAMVKIRQAGGITIAESEESAIVFGMPREAIERGGAEIVAPSWEIANHIIRAVEQIMKERQVA